MTCILLVILQILPEKLKIFFIVFSVCVELVGIYSGD